MREWLSRIDKDTKDARNKRIFNLWLACYTQEEIAEREGLTQKAVKRDLEVSATLPEGMKPAAEHLTEVRAANLQRVEAAEQDSRHLALWKLGGSLAR